jgi:hypothetical protein
MTAKALIVWIFGASASGKETFIKKIHQGKLKSITRALGWNNKKIVFSNKSIDYVSKNEKDNLGPKREEIVKEVLDLSKENNSLVLIKGQDLDLENKRPERLKKLLPSNKHLIVYLHSDSETLYGRVKKKSWWKKEWDKEGYLKWAKYQVNLLSKLKGFEIISLDSGDSGDYMQKSFPPIFE